MRLTRKTKLQLAVFLLVSLAFAGYMLIVYIDVPRLLFNTGHYTVRMQLPESAGLYQRGNVTYEGTEVGRVEDIALTKTGVVATLSLKDGIAIPSDLSAQVHSQSAVGEQYVALLPHNATSPPLKDGDLITQDRTSVPPNISALLDATNTALLALPKDSLKTTIDESATALGGLGPQLAQIVKGSTTLAIDAGRNQDALSTLIDQAQPLLASQADTSGAISRWAANTATITAQLRDHDTALAGLLEHGPAATAQAKQLLDQLQPSVPLLLANLVSIGQVGLTYRADLEQLLVLLPQGVANLQGTGVSSKNLPPGPYKTGFLSFNLNINLPPPCTTGYLPAASRRPPAAIDYPDRPFNDLFCRIPQDSELNVRGIRNIPCETKPWKRAPTVAMCESDQQYVPLNDGYNWKGDPNATLSGQDVPQLRPPEKQPLPAPPATVPQAVAPMVAVTYDPATGQYVGPDGKTYTQADLAGTGQPSTWQSMLTPAGRS